MASRWNYSSSDPPTLIRSPANSTNPVSLALALALMIEGPPEEVPGFTSISQQGVVCRCTAYCAENAKKNGLPVNSTATALWHAALKRQGFDRGLRRENGSIADWLAGDVVVVFGTSGLL